MRRNVHPARGLRSRYAALMVLEVGTVTGVADGEKDPARRAQRNGYGDRNGDARAGRIALEIPKLMKGS